jgi:hypothetical protein
VFYIKGIEEYSISAINNKDKMAFGYYSKKYNYEYGTFYLIDIDETKYSNKYTIYPSHNYSPNKNKKGMFYLD